MKDSQIFLPEQVLEVDDGAKDLEILSSASLGNAFNTKRYFFVNITGNPPLPNLDVLLNLLYIS